MIDPKDPNEPTSPAEGVKPEDDLITDDQLDGVFGAGSYWSEYDNSDC